MSENPFEEFFDKVALPDLESDLPKYDFTLSQAELNTLGFALAFVKGALINAPEARRLWDHYGKQLLDLSERLINIEKEGEKGSIT